MADNIDITPGSGKTVATDEVSSVHYQLIKPAYGADGSATTVDSTHGLPTATALMAAGLLSRKKVSITTSADYSVAAAVASQTTKFYGLRLSFTAACTFQLYDGSSGGTLIEEYDIPNAGILTLDLRSHPYGETSSNSAFIAKVSAGNCKGIIEYVTSA